MKSNRLFRNTLATVALTAALAAAPIASQAQYAPMPQQYADYNTAPQNTAPQNGAPQYGAPQDVQQAPPAIPDDT